ncbi:MAG: hypothetical protein L0Y56_11620 [Nitrospira sp.]|nr:hypothetical protein [Nitrospira sp.]
MRTVMVMFGVIGGLGLIMGIAREDTFTIILSGVLLAVFFGLAILRSSKRGV